LQILDYLIDREDVSCEVHQEGDHIVGKAREQSEIAGQADLGVLGGGEAVLEVLRGDRGYVCYVPHIELGSVSAFGNRTALYFAVED
jgi:hypothetical protein